MGLSGESEAIGKSSGDRKGVCEIIIKSQLAGIGFLMEKNTGGGSEEIYAKIALNGPKIFHLVLSLEFRFHRCYERRRVSSEEKIINK